MQIFVSFCYLLTFGSSAAKVKKSEKNSKSAAYLHTQLKSSTFAPILIDCGMKTFILRALFALMVILTGLAIIVAVSACNVTRTVTNESTYVQRGDTNVVIRTKTIETYDATKKGHF